MITLKKLGKGWVIKFFRWELWPGAGDPFELAVTRSELKALYKLLLKHHLDKELKKAGIKVSKIKV